MTKSVFKELSNAIGLSMASVQKPYVGRVPLDMQQENLLSCLSFETYKHILLPNSQSPECCNQKSFSVNYNNFFFKKKHVKSYLPLTCSSSSSSPLSILYLPSSSGFPSTWKALHSSCLEMPEACLWLTYSLMNSSRSMSVT